MSKENRQKEYERLKAEGREVPDVLKEEFGKKKQFKAEPGEEEKEDLPPPEPEDIPEDLVEKEQKELDNEQEQLNKPKKKKK